MRRLRNVPRSVGWPIALLIVIAVSAAGATAAQKLTGRDVANSSLTGVDVRNSSLSGADIRNRSLTPRDFSESVRGPQGLQGPPGRDIVQGLKFASSDPLILEPGDPPRTALAVCPADTVAISGAHVTRPLGALTVVTGSYPLTDPASGNDAWGVEVINAGADFAVFSAFAHCVPLDSSGAAALRNRRSSLLREPYGGRGSQSHLGGTTGRLQPGQLP